MQFFLGKVISLKNTQTAVVETEVWRKHRLYQKNIRKNRKIVAHCLLKDVVVGDIVKIVSCSPVSKTKHFLVREKIGKQSNNEKPKVNAKKVTKAK